jgi:serine/threonine-protein kinase
VAHETTADPAKTAELHGAEPGGLGPISDDLVPGTEVGGYVIDGKLGEGGMSVVYAATHPLIGKRAAIKVLSARDSLGAVERFVQEARAVNQIGHPNIVDVFQFGVLPDGRHFLIMELLVGETLGRALARRGSLPLAEIVEILEPTCRALEAAHEKDIVHRDLKPDNVFLVDVRDQVRPRVKLIDFGVAKLLVDDTRLEQTEMGDVVGTPRYLSPEQARAAPEIDHRADIYSLGVMLFVMVAGEPPFVADQTERLLDMHINHAPPRVRSVAPAAPAALDELVDRMLAKDPDARPTLAEVRAVLTSLT